MSKQCPFEPGTYYHLFNHAVGNEHLFRSTENYNFFLKRYTHYAKPIVRTFAYCLMPNHFHFLIQVRPYDQLRAFFETHKNQKFVSKSISNQIGHQLGNWLNSYAKAYNKRYRRRGRLFIESIKRIPVKNYSYLNGLVRYIHWNPVHHGFTEKPEDWPFSSYLEFQSAPTPLLESSKVIEWFGGEEEFRLQHRRRDKIGLIEKLESF